MRIDPSIKKDKIIEINISFEHTRIKDIVQRSFAVLRIKYLKREWEISAKASLLQNIRVFHFYLYHSDLIEFIANRFHFLWRDSPHERTGKSLAKVACNQPTIFSRELLITKACVKGLWEGDTRRFDNPDYRRIITPIVFQAR